MPMWAKPGNDEWLPVPGESSVRFMPLEQPAASAGSNVYLLEFPELFLLVDLGMAQERIAVMAEVINAADPGHAKPLLVILTHCHIDHIAAAPALASIHSRQFAVSAHIRCCMTLAEQDPVLTVSYLFRCVPPLIDSVVPLFANAPGMHSCETRAPFGDNTYLTLSAPRSAVDSALGLGIQDIMVGDNVVARVYATPGHSPDSICLRVGNVVFCGDLPFAGSPGVAGIPGWNREELLASLEAMTKLLQADDSLMVCSGHGPSASRDAALTQFAAAKLQAGRIKGIATLDAGRTAFLKSYALTLLFEVNCTFAIIAGRLLLVAEQLELLEERERSRKIRESAALEALDGLIEQFGRSAEREDLVGEPDTRVPLIAGLILAKIDKMLGDKLFTGIIDPARLRRARNLILDFRNALQGIPFRDLLRPEKPEQLVQCLLEEVTSPPYDDDVLMAATDDHESFVDELMRRMALRPLFSGVSFCPRISDVLPLVAVERGHLLDTLVGLCELLAISGGNRIVIEVAAAGEEVRLTLSTAARTRQDVVSHRKIDFYAATLQLYGARFAVHRDEDCLALVILLPVAEQFEEPVV